MECKHCGSDHWAHSGTELVCPRYVKGDNGEIKVFWDTNTSYSPKRDVSISGLVDQIEDMDNKIYELTKLVRRLLGEK
jgi:hypothetical protein